MELLETPSCNLVVWYGLADWTGGYVGIAAAQDNSKVHVNHDNQSVETGRLNQTRSRYW